MRAVFKKEFLGAFRRMYGYVAVGLGALLSAVLFAVNNLAYQSENTVSAVSAASLITALIVPVIAVNAYPSRKKADTDDVYRTLPVNSRDVVLGKYASALAQLMIPAVIMLFYPVLSGIFTSTDNKLSYSVLLAYVLFTAAWLSVCIFITAISTSRVWAYVFCYSLAVVWYLSGIVSVLIPLGSVASLIGFAVLIAVLVAIVSVCFKNAWLSAGLTLVCGAVLAIAYIVVPESFVGALERFINKLSIFKRFNTFARGIFDIEGILFFVLLTLVFIFLSFRRYERRFDKKKEPPTLSFKRITSLASAFAIAASALVLNVAAGAVPDRFTAFDATGTGKYSVSREAKEYLAETDEDIVLYVLEATGDEAYELYLERLAACSEHITLKHVYYVNEPSFYEEHELSKDAVTANSIVVESARRYSYVSYIGMFVYSNSELGATDMSYSEYQYYYSLFSSNESYSKYLSSLVNNTVMYFDGDGVICSYIEYVTKEIIPDTYYLTGHGELSLDTSSNLYSSYVTPLDISDGSDVPADAACVLVNMPSEDISAAERDALLSYLERGGQLTFITDDDCTQMSNLCAVLAEYGMSAERGVVTEDTSDGEDGDTAPTTEITAKIMTDNDVLYYFENYGTELTVVDANAIKLDGECKETLILTPLIISSDASYVGDSSSTRASYTLACAAETADGARIVWFTGGEAFNTASSTEGAYAVVCAMDWVTLKYKSQLDDVPMRVFAQPSAAIESGGAKFLICLLVTLPIAFVGFGVIVCYKRRHTK